MMTPDAMAYTKACVMQVFVSDEVMREIERAAAAGYPEEACGLLIGYAPSPDVSALTSNTPPHATRPQAQTPLASLQIAPAPPPSLHPAAAPDAPIPNPQELHLLRTAHGPLSASARQAGAWVVVETVPTRNVAGVPGLDGWANGPAAIGTEHAPDEAVLSQVRRTRYAIDPREMLRVERELESRAELPNGSRLEVVGVWHSHPDCEAVPSREDVRCMWPGLVYVIVRVARGSEARARGWVAGL